MEGQNQTSVTEFILLGLTNNPKLQIPLFLLFLLIYIITVLNNIGIIVTSKLDPRLHTPMYFFLSHLSSVDLCYSSVIVPNMLVNYLSKRKVISFLGCAVQMFTFCFLGIVEGLLVTVMAYDRYVSICNPLLYTVVMKKLFCIQLVSGSYLGSLLISLTYTICTFNLSFCGPNIIDHFYCDFNPLLKLSCTDTSVCDNINFISCISVGIVCILVISMSYFYIISTILKIRSREGKQKAFSTCTSHFIVVSLFYVTTFFMYLKPSSSSSEIKDKIVSVSYTVLIPMLNPLIYSLRNKEVKAALRKLMYKRLTFH
ncbi:olfactory receptor 502-like [Rhinatrema bivittatum]|uniref:olfactory receptor 502-like n=1 Tax=Rhinatrema bivittatum TaxID=194408 RepID=UPI0011286506|nr:olfactory receptor 502-like [Rhinatrema bivittatum]